MHGGRAERGKGGEKKRGSQGVSRVRSNENKDEDEAGVRG